MKRVIAVAGMLSLSGCVALGLRSPPAPKSEVADARQAFGECLAKEEPTVDDHLSDAGTVAHALALHCEPEWQTYMSLMRVGATHSQLRIYAAGQAQLRNEIALQVVLQVRAPPRS